MRVVLPSLILRYSTTRRLPCEPKSVVAAMLNVFSVVESLPDLIVICASVLTDQTVSMMLVVRNAVKWRRTTSAITSTAILMSTLTLPVLSFTVPGFLGKVGLWTLRSSVFSPGGSEELICWSWFCKLEVKGGWSVSCCSVDKLFDFVISRRKH